MAVQRNLPGKVVKAIPNPIDIEMVQTVLSNPRSSGLCKPVPQIVYVGQIIPSKGIRELVKACRSINGSAIRVNLVGNIEGQFRADLMSLAAEGNQADWLQFSGVMSREGAMACIRDADIFVLPSYTEGFPVALLEAMALGRPIIATDVGAVPEMLGQNTDTPCGVLIKPREVVELQEAIVDLLSNPLKAGMYGKRARAKVLEQYSSDGIMRTYFDIWKTLTVTSGAGSC
jgi:glycosyltransferase involved in cell wall biosynthesis